MSTERKFDNFDEFAEDYREIHNNSIKLSGADSDFFSEYKIAELKLYEAAEGQLHILDFGCGDGNSSVYIRKHFPNAKITGIDVSEDSIKIANERGLKAAEFQDFDGANLPFDPDSFDMVFTSMVFHHIEHSLHHNLLNDIRRVMKPGGRFYIFEHNPHNPMTRRVVDQCPFDKDAVLLKPSYGRDMLGKAGFREAKVRYTIFIPRHKLTNWLTGLEKFMKWLPIGAQYYIQAHK